VIDWRPIETAPKERLCDDRHTALVYCDQFAEYGVCWFAPEFGWTSDGGDRFDATHWSPLKPPINTRSKEGGR